MAPISRSFLAATFAVALGTAATFAFALPGPTACLLIGQPICKRSPMARSRTASLRPITSATFNSRETPARELNPLLAQLNRNRSSFSSAARTDLARSSSTATGVRSSSAGARASWLAQRDRTLTLSPTSLCTGSFITVQATCAVSCRCQRGLTKESQCRLTTEAATDLSPEDAQNTEYVHEHTTSSSFFKGDEQAVVRNYASARKVVASWLAKVGAASLYARLQRLKEGESFPEVVAE